MFQPVSFVALSVAHIALPLVSYKVNEGVLGYRAGVNSLILRVSIPWLVTSKTMLLVLDSINVMMDKETFGSAAVFATNVVVSSIYTNYLMYKVIEISNINKLATLRAPMEGPITFMIGCFLSNIMLNSVSKENISVGDMIFNKDETSAEFVNSGKLKKSLHSVANSIISSNFAQIFTKIADVEGDLAKFSLATIFAPLVSRDLYTDNTLKVSGDTNSKIDGLGHDGE